MSRDQLGAYEARCPSCGAEIVFSLGATLLKVCDHCGSAVARQGADLKSYGKVAALIPTPSILGLGVKGGYQGAPGFELVGRLQLDHGSGTWDEWLMAFKGGTWAWLSESQGKFHYMGAAPAPPAPEFEDVRVDQTIDLGPPGTFVVTEVRTARFVTAQGELPFDVQPGSALRYADLSGPGGQFATLDYGTGSTVEALYVGREVTPDELGMRGLPDPEERLKKAAGGKLSCPNCGGPLEIRAPDQTQRVACPYCGSLLDATKDLAVLEAMSSVPVKPLVPLGSKGTLEGVQWTVIGFMERSATAEGVRYPWHEYLLYEPRHGFRWLVEAKGHWSFVEPINTGDVEAIGVQPRFRGVSYRHFQGGTAVVDHVVGEFYWAVARGDEVWTSDFISPPYMLSSEGTDAETNWSFGTYKEPDEIWKAFHLVGGPPAKEGVAPHQPSPFTGRVAKVWSLALLGLGLVFCVYIGLRMSGGRAVHHQSVVIPPRAASMSPEAVLFTDPIVLDRAGNLEVRVRAPLNNSWLYLDGALVNEATSEVDEFDIEITYYSGIDPEDGVWSEGGPEGRAYVASVPPGRYVMRLAPQWEVGKTPPSYDLTVVSRVPRFYQMLLAMLALLVWPIILGWRSARYEAARWAESDHAAGSGSTSSSDDDDEGDDE